MSSLPPIRARARGARPQHSDDGPPDFGRATRGPRRAMRAPPPPDPYADPHADPYAEEVVDDMSYGRAPLGKRFSRSSASGMPPSSSFHDAVPPSDGSAPFSRAARAGSPEFVDAPGAPSGAPSAGGVTGRFATAVRRRLSRTGGPSAPHDPATATATDETMYAPPASLNDDGFPPRRRRPARMDVIDTLDSTGIRPDMMFHHDSAYDAVGPHGAAAFKHSGRAHDDEPHHSSESAAPETYIEGAEETRKAPRASARARAPADDDYDFPRPAPLHSSRPGQSARARNARTLEPQGERGVYSRQQPHLASRGLFADMAPEQPPVARPPPPPGARMRALSSQDGHPVRSYDQLAPSNNPQAEMWGHADEPWTEFAETGPRRRNGSAVAGAGAGAGAYSQSSGNSSPASMEAALRANSRAPKHRVRALHQTYGSEFDEQPPSPHENMPSRPHNKRSKSFFKLVGMKKPEPFAMQASIDQMDDNGFGDPFPGAWPGAVPAAARRSTSRQRQEASAQDAGNRKARSVKSFRSALSRKTSTDEGAPSPATDEGAGLGSRLRRIASRSSIASKSQGDDDARAKLPRRSSVRQSITTLARRMSLGAKPESESEDDGRAAYARTGAYESESDGDLDAPMDQPVRRSHHASMPARNAQSSPWTDERSAPRSRSRSRGRGPQAPAPPGPVHPQAELFSREVRARPVDRSAVRTRPARSDMHEYEPGSPAAPPGSAPASGRHAGAASSRRSERSGRSLRSELKPTKASLRKVSTAASGAAHSSELEENPEYMSAARSISGRSARSGRSIRSGHSGERRLSTGARSQRSGGGAVSDYTGDTRTWSYEQPAVSSYGHRAPQAFRADPRDDVPPPIQAAPKTSLLGKLTRKGSRKVAAL